MPAEVRQEKLDYAKRLNGLIEKYSKVVFVGVDNVTSQQLHRVRRELRGKGELIMGKKTMQKKIITLRSEQDNATENDKLMKEKFVDERVLAKNCGLIFTNEDLGLINTIILANRIQAPARVGSISPVEVIVPAGNTGLEPTVTSFFQALNIMTKISKGTVEIVSDKKVLSVGDKVDNSTATLLQKLNINPFFYGLDTWCVWDRGVLFGKEDLAFDDTAIQSLFTTGITNITALSLGSGIPTEASFPHLVLDAFKNLLAISIETNYEFTEFNGATLRKQAKEGKIGGAAAAAPAAAAAKAAPVKEEKKPVVEEEEDDDVGMGLLF